MLSQFTYVHIEYFFTTFISSTLYKTPKIDKPANKTMYICRMKICSANCPRTKHFAVRSYRINDRRGVLRNR
jgi:hypothetical protein